MRYRIDADPLVVSRNEVGVVVARDAVATRLADVLVGLDPPVEGSVRLDRDDVTSLAPGPRRIGLVPVGGDLLPHLTVERNIAYGLRQMSARSRRDRARHVSERLQLDGLGRLRPHELSPVQRLQVAVARVLCQEPEPVAVVVEDRARDTPCRAAVATAVGQGMAVVVLTDDAARADTLSSQPMRQVIDAGQP